jgi:hypothetical protein
MSWLLYFCDNHKIPSEDITSVQNMPNENRGYLSDVYLSWCLVMLLEICLFINLVLKISELNICYTSM